ncbi:glycosyltransferase family A protein [Christiangramia salexigens]|uniref:Glycosyltransferase 2-like domain-containing protein n=1 Tax=Christiangramia salexigens TaxID=1913577 RepID=A0A1L3J4S6_9FLAO|nr:glycosyltransferase family 2 protein [Christiangramia salexigens]APG60110.1 hypothetical protein LPB144_06630 [Christiangramia salexigens]
MDLAIVIPYFKKEFFGICLESLAKQTNKNFKVYIGNDGSPEDPRDLIELYSEKIKIEYHYFSENLGGESLVRHWNRCIAKTRNESWILILGDDDVLGEYCIENFYKSLDEINLLKINVVRYATLKINAENEIISKTYLHPKLENSINSLFRKLNGETRSSLSEYIFRKDKLFDIGLNPFPLAWHTDDLLILECSNFGKIFTLNESKVFFRLSGLNISSLKTNLVKKNEASFLFYCYLLQKYKFILVKEQRKIIFLRALNCFDNNKWNFSMLWCISKLTLELNFIRTFLQFWKKVIKRKVQNL